MTAPGEHEGLPISRRLLLRGGALGLSALGAAWARPSRALGLSRAVAGHPGQAAPPGPGSHLVANYQPSQPTGWGPQGPETLRDGVGVTIGGHTASVSFTFQGTPYQVSLLRFDQPGNSPDPIYEPVPSDPAVSFHATLEKAYGAYYSFRYTGGFTGQNEISVQSYNARAVEPTTGSPATAFGAELYFVYQPDLWAGDPPLCGDLQWIQVVNTRSTLGPGGSMVDNPGQANPYYLGALTSIYGRQLCNFFDGPLTGSAGKGQTTLRLRQTFETFLVQDNGIKDAAGKGIINIYGGVKWGWQVQPAHG
jgi:hypothetical protein